MCEREMPECGGFLGRERSSCSPSIVGSYSSTKWLWINWIVKHDFPTPPPPTTTSLYSRRNYIDSRKSSAISGVMGRGDIAIDRGFSHF